MNVEKCGVIGISREEETKLILLGGGGDRVGTIFNVGNNVWV